MHLRLPFAILFAVLLSCGSSRAEDYKLVLIESANPDYRGHYLTFQAGRGENQQAERVVVSKGITPGSYWRMRDAGYGVATFECNDPAWNGFYLDIQGGREDNAKDVIIWKAPSAGMKWRVADYGGGMFCIEQLAGNWNGHFLDLGIEEDKEKPQVKLRKSTGPGSRWRIVKAPAASK